MKLTSSVRKYSTRHVVVTSIVGMKSDSTLERRCCMWRAIDHDTTLFVIECEQSRDRARHRKGVIRMNKFQARFDLGF